MHLSILFLVCLGVGQVIGAKPCKRKLPTTTTATTTPNSTDVTEITETTNSTEITDFAETTNSTDLTETTNSTDVTEITEITNSTDSETTLLTTEAPTTSTIDPALPCMAEWSNMNPDDSSYFDASSGSSAAASSAECGEICMKDTSCAYVFYNSGQCVTFPKFTVLDFDKNGKGSMLFKLYLNGTGTCSTISLPKLSSSRTKMYYPEGGSYWLFDNIMDLISYACYNPELGYKRRKRSLFNWLFNF